MTFVFGGVAAAAPVVAQPGDGDGTSQDANEPGDTGSGSDEQSPGEATPDEPGEPTQPDEPTDGGPVQDPDEPEVGRDEDPAPEETGGDSGVREEPAPEPPAAIPKYQNSIRIPWVRLPAAGEIPAGTWPTASTFYTTVAIPVPTLEEFLRALRVVPAPAPAPGPAFRIQEEAPPVADATTGTIAGGGGGGGAMAEPVVFRAPLVTVPRATTVAGRPTKTPPGTPAETAVPPGVTQPGVAGVRTPAIRGSVAPTPGASAPLPAAPAGAQSPRVGAYPRSMTSPTLAEIAAVALPGVAGLLFLTFSGGMIGYRQANSARFVRTAGAERFLP
ncbi:hypothetical protein PDG61_24390 [Mycolicibacterium sp. BiH015]|uniref:hypothetical protein n=1 Tax=Mycolicibacterium sp. BiH015 TaxID=3018808 RepID=UPI0022E7DEAB|nr:hypothetical protein [Mycolicibacterium sp. BiH015]MDA2894069.1 hypothetical protein [Mycolicibacterium sp. BiH015]